MTAQYTSRVYPGTIRTLEDAIGFARTLEPAALAVYVADWSDIVGLCDAENLWTTEGIETWLRKTSQAGPVLAQRLAVRYVSPRLKAYWSGETLDELNVVFRRITASLGDDSIRAALQAFADGRSQMEFETPAGGDEWVRPLWLVPPSRPVPYGVTVLDRLEPDRAAGHELRRSEARYRAIVEDQTDFVVRYRPDGVRTFVNHAYATFFGGTPDEYVGTSFLDLIAEEHRAAVLEKVRRLCDRERRSLVDEHLSRRHDGEMRWTHWVDRAIFDEAGNLVELQAVGRDITERYEAEERRLKLERRLAQAQKMEALGTLAGGLAHDFNNTITGIGAYAELLRARADDPERVHHYADRLQEAAEQASELVQNLLQLSRKSPKKTTECSLAKILDSAGHLLRSVVPEGIDLVLECDELPPVWADAGQLTQAVINLGLNARDAMADGGTLRIAAYGDGREAVIRVADDGEGMPGEVRERIFEPFFTTKPEGRGTGLGLAMVYACAQAHGGRLEVDSEVGRGTTVELRLPLPVPHSLEKATP